MIQELKRMIRKNKLLCKIIKSIYRPISWLSMLPSSIAASRLAIERIQGVNAVPRQMNIFYFGVPAHSNLGDQAQWYCIKKWLNLNYPQSEIVEFTDNMIKDNRYGLLDLLKQKIRAEDLIVFQSGYCTTDQNMPAEIMHRVIIKEFPNNQIIVFPQTVNYFLKKEQQISSAIYNTHEKMLLLARDKVSFSLAQEIFSKVKIDLYPDIVTSLIGKYTFNFKRDKVLFCMRNDAEQFYEKSDIQNLRERISPQIETEITDTSINMDGAELQKNIQNVLEHTFEQYSRYKAIITDRYHGTIFSLIAGTPVVVLDSTDHKLSSGVDWFKDIYPGYIFFAHNLTEAYSYIQEILANQSYNYKLDDYFDREYYQKLKKIVSMDEV